MTAEEGGKESRVERESWEKNWMEGTCWSGKWSHGANRLREDQDEAIVHTPSVAYHRMVSTNSGSSSQNSARRRILHELSPLSVATEREALLPPCLYWNGEGLVLGCRCYHLDCRLPPPNVWQHLSHVAWAAAGKREATLCFFSHIPTSCCCCSPFFFFYASAFHFF